MNLSRIPPYKVSQPHRVFMHRRIFGRTRWGCKLMREWFWIWRRDAFTNKMWKQGISERHVKSLIIRPNKSKGMVWRHDYR